MPHWLRSKRAALVSPALPDIFSIRVTDQPDPDTLREEMIERWEHAAPGWGRHAEHTRELGMPVSTWMIEQLSLQPGQDVLELAAGPGDTGFLAAELIVPGGKLISSDASEAMLDVARRRAESLGVRNVEFKQLQLEWIDLPTASVDAVLCRWGFMLIVDPATGLRESRRVLAPGGRIALAVWDQPAENPWATITSQALIEAGALERPDPGAPGMFALANPGQLEELLGDAGFVDIRVEPVQLDRGYDSFEHYWSETVDLSQMVSGALEPLSAQRRAAVENRVRELARPFTDGDGRLMLPGRSLAASASS
jgi:SAM-dependent methyltransferase